MHRISVGGEEPKMQWNIQNLRISKHIKQNNSNEACSLHSSFYRYMENNVQNTFLSN